MGYGDGGFLAVNALSLTRSSLQILGIKFTNFGTIHHGGVISIFTAGVFNLYLFKCRFTNNYAKYSGGAIFYDGDDKLHTETLIKECTFKDNEADLYGGGIAIRTWKALMNVEIKSTDFISNYAKENGGGIM